MTATIPTSIIELPLRGEWELPCGPLHDRFAFDFQNGRSWEPVSRGVLEKGVDPR